MDPLYLKTAPPLDPAWLEFEQASGLNKPKPALTPLERQPIYAAECRARTRKMLAPGARDHHLSQGITVTSLSVPSTTDGYAIPVLQFSPSTSSAPPPPSPGPETLPPSTTVVIYIHGGGLVVGEADSEELTCRRIVAESGLPNASVYSIGYRLMPAHPATTCVSDCVDAFEGILASLPSPEKGQRPPPKVLVVGSSSGGELAALLAGRAARRIDGLALRCPVTSDAGTDPAAYVPARWRPLHTSAADASFVTTLLGPMARPALPRDGLPYMPLEAGEDELKGMPRRAWVQVCTNDVLYSDGVCYARALEEVGGVEVRVDVVRGWPHTFWLKAPELDRALEAERELLRGLAWLAG